MRIQLVFTELNQKFGALRSQHGLSSISAVLKKNGYKDVGLSYFSDSLDMDRWAQDLKTFRPDVVGFYSTADQFQFVRKLAEATPKPIFTIAGGPHPTCYPACLDAVPRLDAICVGEGEYPFLELVQALEQGKDPSKILNLWVRRNGDIIRNPTRPFLQNLDELPYEDRELFNTQAAIDQYGLAQIRIMASRGCPFQCTYCSNKRMSCTQEGKYVRHRSADNIIGELKELQEKYKFEEVFFDDDIFVMNHKVVEEFCERYPKEIGKPWVLCGRVEVCTEPLLKKMKDAGARRIDFGLESGNEEVRREILKRRMTNKQILDAALAAKRVGMQVKTLNMVGLPGETKEKFWDTIRLNQQIQPDVVSLFTLNVYPGTEIYDYCVEKGYFKPGEELPENYVSRRDTQLDLPGFSREEIAHCFKWFPFHVFKGYSLVKAVGYMVIYSKHGEFFLALSKKFRKVLRKVLKGL